MEFKPGIFYLTAETKKLKFSAGSSTMKSCDFSTSSARQNWVTRDFLSTTNFSNSILSIAGLSLWHLSHQIISWVISGSLTFEQYSQTCLQLEQYSEFALTFLNTLHGNLPLHGNTAPEICRDTWQLLRLLPREICIFSNLCQQIIAKAYYPAEHLC